MNTRLTINLHDGLLDVQGSEDFVRTIYQDFKEQVAKNALKSFPATTLEQVAQPQADIPQIESGAQLKRRRSGASDAKTKASSNDYKPTYKDMDFSGLDEFYDGFDPKTHSEKILCFAMFLRDRLAISPCSADDIYSCYFSLRARTKIPEAFYQAFIDAKNRTRFISIDWPNAIGITIAGENYFNDKLKAGAPK